VTDIPFNALVLVVDLFVFRGMSRAKTGRRRVLVAAFGLLLALAAAALLSEGIFHLIRLHTYILFAHVPLTLVGLAWIRRSGTRWFCRPCLALALTVLAIAVYAFLIEPYRIERTDVALRSSKLTQRLRVAVVADLQTDRIGAYERKALQMALDAEPDLILLTGDYLQAPEPESGPLASAFRRLLVELDFGAPLGAFAVQGNVERSDWPELFEGTRVSPQPATATLEIGEITLTPVNFYDTMDTRLQGAPSERFQLAFGHHPDFAMGPFPADLIVAGHTHGGQVRLPFVGPLLNFSRVPRSWTSGTTRLEGDRTLVVSRGIGMERGRAPRLRFLCRPEVVIIDVLPR
jgi:predicted MPP superfamily phosphohydrolase